MSSSAVRAGPPDSAAAGGRSCALGVLSLGEAVALPAPHQSRSPGPSHLRIPSLFCLSAPPPLRRSAPLPLCPSSLAGHRCQSAWSLALTHGPHAVAAGTGMPNASKRQHPLTLSSMAGSGAVRYRQLIASHQALPPCIRSCHDTV